VCQEAQVKFVLQIYIKLRKTQFLFKTVYSIVVLLFRVALYGCEAWSVTHSEKSLRSERVCERGAEENT
jgi:hypothetical protein